MLLSADQIASLQEKVTTLEKELAACNIKIASLQMAVARQNRQHHTNASNQIEEKQHEEKNKKAHDQWLWSGAEASH